MIMLNAFKQSPPICNVKDPKSVLEVLNFDPTHYHNVVIVLGNTFAHHFIVYTYSDRHHRANRPLVKVYS